MGLEWLAVLVAAALRGIWLLHGYLNNASAFPQPLPPQEERDALAALQAGDPSARNRLIEHNLRLVAHIAKKFDGCGEDPEDLISIGTVGLIKGVETFNPAKGTRLATYAARCIENDVPVPSPRDGAAVGRGGCGARASGARAPSAAGHPPPGRNPVRGRIPAPAAGAARPIPSQLPPHKRGPTPCPPPRPSPPTPCTTRSLPAG